MNAYSTAMQLQKRFPNIRNINARDEDTIHLGDAAEGGEIDGLPAADYYGEFQGNVPWIHPKLKKAVERYNYYIEWMDPGTLTAYYEGGR